MADPLFILAPPRSYTSLVNAMLGVHPQAFGLPELNLFTVETLADLWSTRGKNGQDISEYSTRKHGLLRTVAEIYAGEQSTDSIQMARHWVNRRFHRTTGEIYRELVDAVDPLITVEKSPAYVVNPQFMERILETFPNAKFIHLVRHPWGQCKSVMNLLQLSALVTDSIDYSGDEPILDPQIAWHDSHINILEFLETVPRENYIRVLGEVFLEHCDEQLAMVCDWLGIRSDAQAIEAMKHPESSPFSCFGPAHAALGNDPNFLRKPHYTPFRPSKLSLDEPLPWRPDGRSFNHSVVALAHDFGY
ncbi:sulfotransferase [Mangrovimicrobium sediminis]|uniref:Sulfotransferase n=1 Tax=Mangrovimicrobium sediminis TaxID=2562682 RepID=A0A4Z0M9D2_9GAMM|nr:sulfotransferase [Haliea sp. SAOS-164]TGD76094.1 sulfotransferase [Haliea sp. SAOS-164]